MKNRWAIGLAVCALVLGGAGSAQAAPQKKTVSEFTAGMECQAGFVPLCWDAAKGKLYMKVSRLGQDFLYVTSQASGLGSNPVGIDRGGTSTALVRFERIGPRVLLVQQNTRYRALTGNEALKQGVADQFPVSVLRGWEIKAEENGQALVDATLFFTRDATGIAARLKRAGQGNFRLDQKDRSFIHLPRTKVFPKNTEVEALLTFASDSPGRLVRQVAPDASSVTLRVHHSLVELPATPMQTRRFDPRVGMGALTFNDYAQPSGGRLDRRVIRRWRLEKTNPGAKLSAPMKPIVFYLDPAMPETIRSAIREGAMWWNRMFEAAGFQNAYQVRDLPGGADPRDLRYSIIQWGHRADRGWSWGGSVTDPRTGEILKAVVFFDSHRQRTDYNLWSGMSERQGHLHEGMECRAAEYGLPSWVAQLDANTTSDEFVLARARQLSAHEVGHTLGLAHNFAASTYGRASVMDYPAPFVKLTNGRVDLSDAYRPGPGDYDAFAIAYGYSVFAAGQEEAGLKKLVADGLRRGMLFLTDRDARPISGSDPRAQLWDNQADPLLDLQNSMEVRRVLLDSFSEAAIDEGEPLWLLEERLAPIYYYHRFALERVTKMVGGMEYVYAVKGDGQTPARVIDAQKQREALRMLGDALQPAALRLPDAVRAKLAPPPYGFSRTVTNERFASGTWPAFDELGAARSQAAVIVGGILNRNRAARLVAFGLEDEDALSLREAIGHLLDATWNKPWPDDAKEGAFQRVVHRVVLDGLLELAADKQASAEVRAVAEWALADLLDDIKQQEHPNPLGEAMRQMAERDIQRFLSRPGAVTERSKPLDPPPGSPIGQKNN